MVEWVLHLDMDCFFVSVERLYDPSLIGKPVIVGADPEGRGVVCAASYEARRFGVHSAMPISQAARLCPQGVFLRPRGRRYGEFSAQVKERLVELAPVVVQASIDEFDCELTGCERLYRGDLFGACRRVQQQIQEELGLPCSIGLATTRLVAKVAAGRDKPRGAVFVPAGEEARFLAPLDVGSLPGVGPKLRPWLDRLGVRTVGDLARLGPVYLRTTLGRTGEALYQKSIGRCGSLQLPAMQKSISREMTFAVDTEDPVHIRRCLSRLSEDACRQLRACGARAGTVGLKLRYADFRTITRDRRIIPSALDHEIFPVVLDLWERNDSRRVRIRLVGVRLFNLTTGPAQGLLFDELGPAAWALLSTVDRIGERYGAGTVCFARSLSASRREP